MLILSYILCGVFRDSIGPRATISTHLYIFQFYKCYHSLHIRSLRCSQTFDLEKFDLKTPLRSPLLRLTFTLSLIPVEPFFLYLNYYVRNPPDQYYK